MLDKTVAEISEAVGADIPSEIRRPAPDSVPERPDPKGSIRLELQSYGPEYYHFANINRASEHTIGIGNGSKLLYGIQIRDGKLTIFDPAGNPVFQIPLSDPLADLVDYATS